MNATPAVRTIAALLVTLSIVTACSTVEPTSEPTAVSTASVARSRGSTTVAPTVTPTQQPRLEPVDLVVSQTPAFAGDRLTFTVQGELGGPTPMRFSSARIGFNDGTEATGTSACAPSVEIEHAFREAGDWTATLVDATSCDSTIAADLTSTAVSVQVFPSAPPASADWPVCTTFQLSLTAGGTGAAGGSAVAQILMENVSKRGCTLEGYPDVALIGRSGRILPTHSSPATTGAYLFPAVVPHRVGLAPGAFATFLVAYADTPFGPNADGPYEVACPPAVAMRVTFPGTHEYGTAAVSTAPCNGAVEVSPIVPGKDRFEFS